MMTPIRPAFWVDVKVRITYANGSTRIVWCRIDQEFDGRNVECALAHAVEKASDEVRRVSRRPAYRDLKNALGGEYHVLNVRFVRVGVEDEDVE